MDRRVLYRSEPEKERGVDLLIVGERLDLSAPVAPVFESGDVLAVTLDTLVMHTVRNNPGEQKAFGYRQSLTTTVVSVDIET